MSAADATPSITTENTLWTGNLRIGEEKRTIGNVELVSKNVTIKPSGLPSSITFKNLVSIETALQWPQIRSLMDHADAGRTVWTHRELKAAVGDRMVVDYVTYYRLVATKDTVPEAMVELVYQLTQVNAVAVGGLRGGVLVMAVPSCDFSAQLGIPLLADADRFLHCLFVAYKSVTAAILPGPRYHGDPFDVYRYSRPPPNETLRLATLYTAFASMAAPPLTAPSCVTAPEAAEQPKASPAPSTASDISAAAVTVSPPVQSSPTVNEDLSARLPSLDVVRNMKDPRLRRQYSEIIAANKAASGSDLGGAAKLVIDEGSPKPATSFDLPSIPLPVKPEPPRLPAAVIAGPQRMEHARRNIVPVVMTEVPVPTAVESKEAAPTDEKQETKEVVGLPTITPSDVGCLKKRKHVGSVANFRPVDYYIISSSSDDDVEEIAQRRTGVADSTYQTFDDASKFLNGPSESKASSDESTDVDEGSPSRKRKRSAEEEREKDNRKEWHRLEGKERSMEEEDKAVWKSTKDHKADKRVIEWQAHQEQKVQSHAVAHDGSVDLTAQEASASSSPSISLELQRVEARKLLGYHYRTEAPSTTHEAVGPDDSCSSMSSSTSESSSSSRRGTVVGGLSQKDASMLRLIEQILETARSTTVRNPVLDLVLSFENAKQIMFQLATKQPATLQQLIALIRNPHKVDLPADLLIQLEAQLVRFSAIAGVVDSKRGEPLVRVRSPQPVVSEVFQRVKKEPVFSVNVLPPPPIAPPSQFQQPPPVFAEMKQFQQPPPPVFGGVPQPPVFGGVVPQQAMFGAFPPSMQHPPPVQNVLPPLAMFGGVPQQSMFSVPPPQMTMNVPPPKLPPVQMMQPQNQFVRGYFMPPQGARIRPPFM